MDTGKILNEVDRLHANAKDGSVKINGVKYLLEFNGHSYVATREDGGDIPVAGKSIVYNTRKLSVAKQWLKEWLIS